MNVPGHTVDTVAAAIQAARGGPIRSRGHEKMVRCAAHADNNPSLSLTPVSEGVILVHCHAGCGSADLMRAILPLLRISREDLARSIEEAPERNVTKPARSRYIPRPFVPGSFHRSARSFDHYMHGAPSLVWPYKLPSGRVAAWMARYDLPDGKEFAPFSWAYDTEQKRERLVMRAPSPRPLFNLDKIVARPDDPIVWHEGEKAATAARSLFPEWLPTTTMNGVNSVNLTDFSPCRGRHFIVSPDNDGQGIGAANTAARLAAEAGATSVSILSPPAGFLVEGGGLVRGEYVLLEGDDAADHKSRGWTGALWREALARAGIPLLRRLLLP